MVDEQGKREEAHKRREAEHPGEPAARYARRGATIPTFHSFFLGFPHPFHLILSCSLSFCFSLTPIHLRFSQVPLSSSLSLSLNSISYHSAVIPLALATVGVMFPFRCCIYRACVYHVYVLLLSNKWVLCRGLVMPLLSRAQAD